MESKRVAEFSVENHGVDNPQYFRGAGVAFTEWDECFVGIGNTPREALDDALEMAAQSDVTFETEPDAIEEFGAAYADRETVAEAIDEYAPSVPDPIYRARLYSACGMTQDLGPDRETENEAEQDAIAWAQGQRDAGIIGDFEVTYLPAPMAETLERIETFEPDDCAMIPDEVGTVHVSCVNVIEFSRAEKAREEYGESADLQHYVVLYVKLEECPTARERAT